jgi:hypothetical protein
VLAKVFVLTSQTAEVPQILLNLNRTCKSSRAVCTTVSHKKRYKICTNLEELPEDADARQAVKVTALLKGRKTFDIMFMTVLA